MTITCIIRSSESTWEKALHLAKHR